MLLSNTTTSTDRNSSYKPYIHPNDPRYHQQVFHPIAEVLKIHLHQRIVNVPIASELIQLQSDLKWTNRCFAVSSPWSNSNDNDTFKPLSNSPEPENVNWLPIEKPLPAFKLFIITSKANMLHHQIQTFHQHVLM